MVDRDHLLELLIPLGYKREEVELKIERKESLQQLLLEILIQLKKEKENTRMNQLEKEEEADEIDYKLLYEDCKQFLNELISSTNSQLKLRSGGP